MSVNVPRVPPAVVEPEPIARAPDPVAGQAGARASPGSRSPDDQEVLEHVRTHRMLWGTFDLRGDERVLGEGLGAGAARGRARRAAGTDSGGAAAWNARWEGGRDGSKDAQEAGRAGPSAATALVPLPADSVSPAARIGGRPESAVGADDTAHTAPERRPSRAARHGVTESPQSRPSFRGGWPRSAIEQAGKVRMRPEGIGEAPGGDAGGFDRLLRGHAVRGELRKTCSMACCCTSPPGVPNGMKARPSLEAPWPAPA